MSRALTTGIVALCCLSGGASEAFAQGSGSDRPFRGLFGRGNSGAGGQSLDVTATLVEAYDDNLLAEVGTPSPGAAALSGYYTMLQAATRYAWVTRALELGINGSSAFRSYGSVSEIRSAGHAVAVGLSSTLPGRTRIGLNQGAAYSPSYLFGLFPSIADTGVGDIRPTAPDYAIDDLASYSYATTASLSRGLTRRGSVTAGADYSFTDFVGTSTARRDGSSYGARAGFSRLVGRRSGLSLDYQYRTGDFGLATGGKSSEHGVTFGVEHTRVLSAARRAQYSFGVGAAATTLPPGSTLLSPSATVNGREQLYRVTADGALSYQFSRTGELRATYQRGVEYIVELEEPVSIDGVSAGVSGSLGRRLELSVGAGYSSGASALQQASKFKTYTGNVRGQVPLTRTLGIHLEYLYYYYDFGGSSLLAPGLPPRLERNGVRAGLTLFTPIMRR